jgi:hypothetical protein
MTTPLRLAISVSILFLGTLLISARLSSGFNFGIGETETVILDGNFDLGSGWQLGSSLTVQNGVLTHQERGSYGQATYPLNPPLNLNDGAINLYWVGTFPAQARKERDAYWVSLEYADNPDVCWQPSTNVVTSLETSGNCGTHAIQVDENSQLKVWLRPEAPSSYLRLYLDIGFIPGKDPEALVQPLAQLRIPPHPDAAAEQYRLRIVLAGDTAEAALYYWNNHDWQALTGLNNSSPCMLNEKR